MPLGESINRTSDVERAAGLRGWMLLPLIIIALSVIYGTFAVGAMLIYVKADRSSLLFLAIVIPAAAYVILGWCCVWYGFKRKRITRPLITAYFAIGLVLNAVIVFGSLGNPIATFTPLTRIVLDAAIIWFVGFTERAKLTFAT